MNLRKCITAVICAVSITTATQTVGLQIHDRVETAGSEGYNLFTSRKYNTTYLVDMEGRNVQSWVHGTDGGAVQRVEHAKIVALSGTSYLMRTCRLPGDDPRDDTFSNNPGYHGRIELVDWDNNVVWYYEHASDHSILHHDAIALPNGNIVMSVWDVYTEAEMLAHGKVGSAGTVRYYSERLIEVTPDISSGSGGTIVWQWEVMDHLGDNNPSKVGINTPRKATTADWNHVSGLAYNAEKDWIMLSMHQQSELMIIDHNTTTSEAEGSAGDILYRWGKPDNYGGTGIRQLYALHHPHWIPEGLPRAGKILVINNGHSMNPKRKFSHVDMIDPGSYEAHDYSDPIWYYGDNNNLDPLFFTQNLGSAQMLPNGNMLIDEAVKGRFFEINNEKEVVWQYTNPVIETEGPLDQGATIGAAQSGDLLNEAFRCIRYFADNPFFEGKDLIGGDPLEGYSSITRDTIIKGETFNWQGTDYTETGIYIIENSGWHYLDLVVKKGEAKLTNALLSHKAISITVNGTALSISFPITQSGVVTILSANGRQLLTQRQKFNAGSNSINTESLSCGVYVVQFKDMTGATVMAQTFLVP